MIGGLVAAVIGSQLVIGTRDAISGVPYVGSFLSQAALPLMAVPILLLLRAPPAESPRSGSVRGAL